MHVSIILLLVTSLMILAHAQTTADYCALCSDHTMCKYSGFGTACKPVYISAVTAAEQKTILDLHNQVRNKIATGQETLGSPGPQPAAANMRKLVWDTELASIAQRWTNQCTFGHDTCRKVSRFGVGQNAAWGGSTQNSTTPDWKWAIQTAWYGEVSLYNKANINPFGYSSGTGHYTQVAWAKTITVGCGYAYYKTTSNTYYNKLYICNYGPAGNMIGSALYIAGTACSQCPSGTTCDTTYPGLCK